MRIELIIYNDLSFFKFTHDNLEMRKSYTALFSHFLFSIFIHNYLIKKSLITNSFAEFISFFSKACNNVNFSISKAMKRF